MTSRLTQADALTRGQLQFAIVEAFNADTEPDESSMNINGKPYYGDGSGDMTGTVRLMDGIRLSFDYVDGRYPVRDDDGSAHWDEEGYSPARGGRGMSWPFEGNPILVEVEAGRVRRWTWPGLVMAGAYRINDHRYLTPPAYANDVQFPGLHCLVDISKLSPEWATQLVSRPECDFPGAAVYVGHHADAYLKGATTLYALAVFTWDQQLGKSRLVSFAAKLA